MWCRTSSPPPVSARSSAASPPSRDVDLRVAEGSVHALVGPNGAGKTTLFNMLTGFLTPVRRAGSSSTDRTSPGVPPERIARLGVARSFQITTLFPALTARDHVELALQARTHAGLAVLALGQADCDGSATEAEELLDEVGPRRRRRRRRPARSPTAASARSNWPSRSRSTPRLLLLDEPTAGMGAEDIDSTVALMRRVARGPHGGAGRAQHERRRRAWPTGSPCCSRARCSPRAPTTRSAPTRA